MPRAIATGTLLKGRYRLERTLGHGGMAAVCLGHDEVLDRPVAVKVLSDVIASDPSFIARFRREAHTAAKLSHRNLVRVYDFSDEGERPYLVMEFVPGEDLATRSRRGREIDTDRLARELLDALAHIHAVGILHRDIKPGNIVIEPDGTARLIDFGIALPPDATSLTSTGLIIATERYAAPEVMEGHPATERSDLYSCGMVLRSCPGAASPALERLIESMTSRDPAARPLSAGDALAELETPERRPEQPTQVFEPTLSLPPRRPPRRRGRIAAGVALAIVALAIVAVVVIVGGGNGGGKQVAGGTGSAAKAHAKGESKSADQESAGEGSESAGEGSAAAEPQEAGESEASTETASTAIDPGRGAELNEQGFAMVQAGEYGEAVPVLEEAVASFPEGTEDINYAYALYNLGDALLLDGRPEEAIPILEQRLQIPDQEDEVRQTLETAQAESGESGSSNQGN